MNHNLSRARERIVPDSLGSFGLPGPQSAWTYLPKRLRADRALTAPYDLFIYLGHGIPPFNSAHRGMIYCHFPFELHPTHELKVTKGWHNRSALSRWGRSIFYQVLWKYRMRGYQTILCNSQFTSGWINRLWYKPTEVLYPPVALQIPLTEKRNAIVSIGRFVKSDHKNHAQQLKAFREFFSVIGGDWRLYMIGFCTDIPQDRACLEKVQEEARDLPVTFVINATRRTVFQHLAEAKLFWHTTGLVHGITCPPDRMEHFGIATVEAMGAGCVPIVSFEGGQPEIVQHEVNGFLCRNVEALSLTVPASPETNRSGLR